MRIAEPGHVYEVVNVDGDGTQTITFVRRRASDGRPLRCGRHEGILGQELLRVLIDRTLYLNAEDPCVEDVEIVHKLRDCLRLYEARAARRTIEKLPMPEQVDACPICHHLLCVHRTPDRLGHGSTPPIQSTGSEFSGQDGHRSARAVPSDQSPGGNAP